ncbi:Solute carrier family 22 member 7 [Chionoecetes opilio]|uniref:Solute carrier family 22 member 7 n=1 Tax=Chionoecetes opilio TaxID=41210 RepID=A0A8J4YJC1_CHIOP|nr:Solute carrier family 22 member 7 [Chionoecetes opilio]
MLTAGGKYGCRQGVSKVGDCDCDCEGCSGHCSWPDGDESPLAASGDADDFDTVLAHVGVGKWNYIYYIAIAYWHVVLPYHTLAGAFLSPSVNHTCHHPSPDLPPTIVLLNNTAAHNALRNTTYLSGIDNSCSYQKEDLATGRLQEVPCTEWDFDNSTFTSTVTSEFSLVCDRRYLRAAHQSIYMGGILVGAFFNGFLADRYGRLRMIAISVILYCVMALGSAWLPSLGLILTSRFLLGTMHPTSLTTGFILGASYPRFLLQCGDYGVLSRRSNCGLP